MPGPVVQPNFLAVMEAVGNLPFPISKRELLELVGDNTVVFQGQNVELHELIKDIYDDGFESEDELREALERHYAPVEGEATELGRLPMGPEGADIMSDWEQRKGIERARDTPDLERDRLVRARDERVEASDEPVEQPERAGGVDVDSQ